MFFNFFFWKNSVDYENVGDEFGVACVVVIVFLFHFFYSATLVINFKVVMIMKILDMYLELRVLS